MERSENGKPCVPLKTDHCAKEEIEDDFVELKTVENEEEDCQEVPPQANPWIADVDCCTRNNRASVMEVSSTEQDWERIALKIDSGAVWSNLFKI